MGNTTSDTDMVEIVIDEPKTTLGTCMDDPVFLPSSDVNSQSSLPLFTSPSVPEGKCQYRIMRGVNKGEYCLREVEPGSNYCAVCSKKKVVIANTNPI
ncbi:Hypothetical protein HVR_LOCUS327 [uncultured virus]|nr:Hypothetical protein HVR_LOCUS327 [uncultured virus]